MPINRSQTLRKENRVAMRPRKIKAASKENQCTKRTARNSSTGMATRRVQQQHQQQCQPLSKQNRQRRSSGKKACAPRPLRLRKWLENLLETGEVSGLQWVDREKRVFSIPWVHKSNHTFDQATHSDIFHRYAMYRGLDTASDFKASFRCAMNTLKDVEQLTEDGAKKGANAKRTYRFLSSSDPNYRRNRKGQNETESSCKGRKRKTLQSKESPSSSPSSLSSWSSTEETASPSLSQSLQLFGSWNSQLLQQSESGMLDHGNIPNTVSDLEQAPLQGSWTQDILQPVASPQAEDNQKASVTFVTNSDGITSVSAPASGEAYPQETKVFASPDDQVLLTRVQVERNIQSGGVVTGLPNFTELGVSDTYTPGETITNTKLACRGQVSVREEKCFALPIPIDLSQFGCSTQQVQIAAQEIRCVPASQESSAASSAMAEPSYPAQQTCQPPHLPIPIDLSQFGCSTQQVQIAAQEIRCVPASQESSAASSAMAEPSYPAQQTCQPPQYRHFQSDLDLGQTLEVPDEADVSQNQSPPKYQIFTPQGDSLPPVEVGYTEAGDVEGETRNVSAAYSFAVAAILNDPSITFHGIGTEELISEIHQDLPVEVQQIEQTDDFLSEIPDLFEMGHI